MKDRTTLVIAHRMTTIEDADKIYVMQNGHVEGCGTHEELLQKDQIYQNLVRAQSYE
jgi:ABC-type multidrug transport system fused ATPase/permease subunit